MPLYLHSTITIKLATSIQYCHSLKLVRTVSVIARFFGVAHKMRSPYIDTSISKSKNFCEPLKKQNFKGVKNSVLFYSRNSCVQYTVEERHSNNKRYLSTVHAKNHMTINLQIQTQNPHAKPDCIMMATFVSLLEERS